MSINEDLLRIAKKLYAHERRLCHTSDLAKESKPIIEAAEREIEAAKALAAVPTETPENDLSQYW